MGPAETGLSTPNVPLKLFFFQVAPTELIVFPTKFQ